MKTSLPESTKVTNEFQIKRTNGRGGYSVPVRRSDPSDSVHAPFPAFHWDTLTEIQFRQHSQQPA